MLTEDHQDDEDGRKASDRIEHKLQVSSYQIQIVVVFNKNRWKYESNSDSKLQREAEKALN
jgi:hypothetical protein